jgi:hypothetical protein
MALRTSSYESILKGCANLAGVKRNQLLTDSAALLFEFINMAFRKGIEADWWPEYLTVEQRYWRDGLWSAGTYPANAIVYYSPDETYYINDSGGATSETPSSTASDWGDPGDFARYISLTQMTGSNLATAETEIDAVKNIYQKDPRTEEHHGGSGFTITQDGIRPSSEEFDSVYVEFRPRQDDMSGMTEWDADSTYLVGDYVYYKGTQQAGEAYKVIVATTAGQDPQDTPASFQQVSMPYILSSFIKHQALADWLGAGGGGSALGDTSSSVGLQAYLQRRADQILENESYNLRARSAQYSNYEIRQV